MTTLLLGGAVYSASFPDATAMAVENGTVVWVGTDDVGRALHPDATVLDLAGRFVTPGVVDSHVHLTSTGLALTGLDLTGARDRAEALRRVAEFAAGDAEDLVVIWGSGWDETEWSGAHPTAPTTAELDALVGNRPVYLARVDEHSAIASTAMRRLAGDLRGLPGFDPDGPLTGEAHHRVRRTAGNLLSAGQRRRAQLAALDAAAAAGIVAVHEAGGPEIAGRADFEALGTLDHPVEIRRYWGEAVRETADARALLAETGADGLAGDLFIDGSIGSHTAWLSRPYTDAPTLTGVSHLDYTQVRDHLRACTEAGIQAGFHVIGDAATDCVAGALAELAEQLGTPALARCAHRLEHAEMISAEQADLFGRCGVVASMQPRFDEFWGGGDGMYAERLGADRSARLNDFALLARSGMGLAFSSDTPVTPLSPWETVRAAVHPHRADSAISPRAAFAAVTRGGWRAARINDGLTGTLAPGSPASYTVWEAENLVVAGSHPGVDRWSTDPRSRVPALPDVSPDATLPVCVHAVHDGRVVFDGGLG